MSCAIGVAQGKDRICAEIAAFAAATESAQPRSIVLRGGWGGDTPDTLVTHDCEHFGDGHGKALCAYLLPNTSWEFGNYNAARAARCLDSKDRWDFVRRVNAGEWPAEITSSLKWLADKRIQVTIRLEKPTAAPARLSDVSVLTLSTARNEP